MRSSKVYVGLALALLSSTSVFAAQTADERIKQLEAEINKLKAEKSALVKNPNSYVAPAATAQAVANQPKKFTWTGFYAGINGGYDWSNGKGGKGGTASHLFSAFSNNTVAPGSDSFLDTNPANGYVAGTSGTSGSGSWSYSDSVSTSLGNLPADRNLSTKRSSAMGGLQGGYNQQYGYFVYGFEADVMGFDAKKSSSATDSFTGTTTYSSTVTGAGNANDPNGAYATGTKGGTNVVNFEGSMSADYAGVGTYTQSKSLQQEWLATLRARAGLSLDKALLFVSAGPAFGDAKAAVSQKLRYAATANDGVDIARDETRWNGSTSQTRIGFALSAGGEYALTENWVIRGEYMYYNLGNVKMNLHQSWASDPVNTGGMCGGLCPAGNGFAIVNKTSTTKVDGNIVRGAVSYKF